MIASPDTDTACLDAVTDEIRTRLGNHDRSLNGMARDLGSTAALVRWIRQLPQRDDDGLATDGPKIAACVPVQRLRLPSLDPNCVERAALYVAVAELLDPTPVRQLTTITTPAGLLHTYPLEDGAAVVLDPIAVPRNARRTAARGRHGHRNGLGITVGRLRITPDLDRTFRIVAQAAATAGPALATHAARLALSSFGIHPDLLGPIESALRREGLTLGPWITRAMTAPAVR